MEELAFELKIVKAEAKNMDSILSLSLSMHSNKGVYALLLGSGISRSAGVPTGWEVVLDLVRKLAGVQYADCEPNPAAWYESEYGEAPDYSKLLDAIAKTPAERRNLLKKYFEPTEEEREQGKKVPTTAHKEIATLVAKGYIRVIITTNFDRLLENALDNTGVVPTIISTPDAVEGAMPLVHSQCTIIKVHGDYLDTRIKNTETELSQYDERLDRLLDRVFDEFGLVVCGWSADWDPALGSAIERCPSRRFTTYWTGRSGPRDFAKRLMDLRRASFIQIKDADTFFLDLSEKVVALEEISRPHPLSAKLAVATLKRYLVDEQHRIRLHDLVMEETERIYTEVFALEAFPLDADVSTEKLLNRIQRYERATEILSAMLATGCFWGEKHQHSLWVKSLERVANPPEAGGGKVIWLKLRLYPALLLLYTGGIAAIAREQYGNLAALFTHARVRNSSNGQEVPIGRAVHTWKVIEDKDVQQRLLNREREYTPLSNHLFYALREYLREQLHSDDDYIKYFNKFEYFLALIYADLSLEIFGRFWGVPVGRFGWQRDILIDIDQEFSQAGQGWLPLQAGLFGGSVDRFRAVKEFVDGEINNLGEFW